MAGKAARVAVELSGSEWDERSGSCRTVRV